MSLNNRIIQYLHELECKGLLRKREIYHSDSTEFIHFDSNDYLSLRNDQRISNFYQKGYSRYPCGSGSSLLISGYHMAHRHLEKEFSNFLKVDDCVLFSSGYVANLAISRLLGQLQSDCIIDKAVHASIYDGLQAAGVKFSRFTSNNMDDLQRKIQAKPLNNPALMTEGIFSMNGQIALLDSITSLCHTNDITVLVDEAHSFGVIGHEGRGVIDIYYLTQEKIPLRMIPFGKALAAQGALVAGKKEWVDALIQAARSLIYSTGISPALCYGIQKTLTTVIEADHRRKRLFELVDCFNWYRNQHGMNWIKSNTPIQFLKLGCPHQAAHLSKELEKKGIKCAPIRSPTVSHRDTGLRMVLNYNHNEDQIKKLFNSLNTLYESTHH